MRIVILGPPGAGKGTQAVLLAKAFDIPHISTGDMLRAFIDEGTELGERVKAILAAGRLVPDDIMIDVIRDRLAQEDCATGFLLDGFPRTVAQAEALDRLLDELKSPLTHVLELSVSSAELTRRLLERAKTQGRSDDKAEVIEERLRVYGEQTRPVSAHYARTGALRQVDGLGPIDDVQARLDAVMRA